MSSGGLGLRDLGGLLLRGRRLPPVVAGGDLQGLSSRELAPVAPVAPVALGRPAATLAAAAALLAAGGGEVRREAAGGGDGGGEGGSDGGGWLLERAS